jgi:hypothetical protein
MTRKVTVPGYARLPEGAASQRLYELLTISTVIDIESHQVVKAGCTLVSDVGREWVRDQLVGVNLLEEPSPFIEAVERDHWGPSAPAIIQAYRDLVKRYRAGLKREGLL